MPLPYSPRPYNEEIDFNFENCPPQLLIPPPYARFNQALGLPNQSRALEGVVQARGIHSLNNIFESIGSQAPFIFLDNYFLLQADFFLRNWDKTKCLGATLQRVAGNIFTDAAQMTAIGEVTHALSIIARNPRLFSEETFFDVAQQLLEAFGSRPKKLSVSQFRQIALFTTTCRNSEDFSSFLQEIKGTQDINTFREKAASRTPISTLGLKIIEGCSRQCGICYEDASADSLTSQKLSLEDLDTMEGVLSNLVSVDLTGGEPTEHPDFIAFCEKLARLKVPFSVTSTGASIETLEKLLPFYTQGKALSFTLSVHAHYGTKGKSLGATTAAFLIQHGIPFAINCPVLDIQNVSAWASPLFLSIATLGLPYYSQGVDERNGKQSNFFYSAPPGKLPRDPLLKLRVNPVYPSGKCIDNPRAIQNARATAEILMQTQGTTRSFCTAAVGPGVRPDKTVRCCSSFSGGKNCVAPMLSHLPTSIEELSGAIEQYHQKLEGIYQMADNQRVLPCMAHRQTIRRK